MRHMKSRNSRLAKLSIGLIGAALTVAACGGGDTESGSADALPSVQVADVVVLEPASDVATNLLPDLVVDNLQDDNKVNLRNFGTSDKPILIWMWAPH